MSNKLILWAILLIVGIGLIISANIFRDTNPGSVSRGTPVPILSPTPSEEQNRGSLISQPSSPNSGEIGATCQLSGEIRFIGENLYETIGAKITYQNVDDPIRQIFWKAEPDDGALTIGPNLFEDLSLPNGEREIGVILNKAPVSKLYILAAAITYGIRNSNGDIEVRNADCVGAITVKTP